MAKAYEKMHEAKETPKKEEEEKKTLQSNSSYPCGETDCDYDQAPSYGPEGSPEESRAPRVSPNVIKGNFSKKGKSNR